MGKKRKTREEKIRTKIRKLQKQLKEREPQEKTKAEIQGEKEKIVILKPPPPTLKTGDSFNRSYLFSDLRKTFLLTLLAISLELMVYWWLEK
jgi:hypothetical protein